MAVVAFVLLLFWVLAVAQTVDGFGDPESVPGFILLLLVVLLFLGMIVLSLMWDVLPEDLTKTEVVNYRLSRLIRFLKEYNDKFGDDKSMRLNRRRSLRQATYLLRSFAPFIPTDGRTHVPLSYAGQTRFDLFTGELGEFGEKVQELAYLLAGILKSKEKKVPAGVVDLLELLRDHLETKSRRLEQVHLVSLNDAISAAKTVGVKPDKSLGKSPPQRLSAWTRTKFGAAPRPALIAAIFIAESTVYWPIVLMVPEVETVIPQSQRFTGWLTLLVLTLMAWGGRRS